MSAIDAVDPVAALYDHIIKALVAKAGAEPEFRALLKANPDAALTELLGRPNPITNLKINVIEDQPGEVTIVLPAPAQKDELPDELLDLASGGVSFSAFVLYGPPYPDSKPKK